MGFKTGLRMGICMPLLLSVFLLTGCSIRERLSFLPFWDFESIKEGEGRLDGRYKEEKPGESGEPPDSRDARDPGAARVSVEELDFSAPLPERYDAREYGRTPPVRDQGQLGTCWAFASLSALESRLLPEESWDFSEDHITHDPNFLLGQEGGGEYTMAMAYLLSWRGPVTEEQDPYGDGFSPDGLAAVKHVQEIRILPERGFEAIKRAVLKWGGVESSLYTDMRVATDVSEYYNPKTSAYFCPREMTPNHEIVIVGWDDDFPREAFNSRPGEDGAFLCENSWSTAFGDGGFFYVSYEDCCIGKNNIVYSGVEDIEHYTRIFQSDLCGWVGQVGYGEEKAWAANVYRADAAVCLSAVGFYAVGQDTDYELYLVRNVPKLPGDADFARRDLLAEGQVKYSGFYTIPFAHSVEIAAGERFAVMMKLKTPGAVHPIAVEYNAGDGRSLVIADDGEGYISLDGNKWSSIEEKQGCNLCLKAYGK